MADRNRTNHEQLSTPRRAQVVGPALLALVVLAALPAAALAVAPNQNTLAEISLLLEQSRRAPRPEARAERSTPAPALQAQRTKPVSGYTISDQIDSLLVVASPDVGPRGAEDSGHSRLALKAMTRAGRTGLPPPTR